MAAGLVALAIAGFAIGIALLLITESYATSEFQSTFDVQLGNKTYQVEYNMSNGGSVESATAESSQPYGGSLLMKITSPSKGVLEAAIPRELFDLVGFTDHFQEGLVIFVDELDADSTGNTLSYCDKIIVHAPIEAQSEEVILTVGDILGVHGHPYPPAIDVTKKLTVEGQEFELKLRTQAAKCDVSFSKEEEKLHIDIDSRGSEGSFVISVPRQMLSGGYTVLVDGMPADNLQIYTTALGSLDGKDPNNSTISFNYSSGAKSIDIIGTDPSNEWKTAHIVGRFLNAEPPKPDQIFKIQYRVINGTMESFDIEQGIDGYLMHNTIAAKVSSNDGILEIKFPRNFPYTNSNSGIGDFIFLVDDEDGSIEDSRTTTDCFFVFSIPFSGSIEIGMPLSSILIKSPYHGDDIPDNCSSQTLVENVPTKKDGTISPRQQFRAGVAAEDVVCWPAQGEGLMLMIGPSGKPYCVKLSNEGFMKARGWTEP